MDFLGGFLGNKPILSKTMSIIQYTSSLFFTFCLILQLYLSLFADNMYFCINKLTSQPSLLFRQILQLAQKCDTYCFR